MEGIEYANGKSPGGRFVDPLHSVFNDNLPYADCIDEEADAYWIQIKTEICKSIAVNELDVSLVFWLNELRRYLDAYRMRVSKEDLESLCLALYSLIVLPEIDQNTRHVAVRTLTKLLKKKDLLPSMSFVLDWRPLLDLVNSHFFPKTRCSVYMKIGSYGSNLFSMIEASRRFFPENATQEMLDYFRPWFCLHDDSLLQAQAILVTFLPTQRELNPEKGYKLWFDLFMEMWSWVENMQQWDANFLGLYGRLSCDCIGKIDWEPYLDFLFKKILNCLYIPVGGNSVPKTFKHSFPKECSSFLMAKEDKASQTLWKGASKLMVGSLRPGGSGCQSRIEQFYKAVESFLHPSNYGDWSYHLSIITNCLVNLFGMRLHEERLEDSAIDEGDRLTKADIRAFVKCLKEPSLVLLYSRLPLISMGGSFCLKVLAYLDPEIVMDEVMQEIYPSLDNLTHSHRTVSSIRCLAEIIRPVLWYEHYPKGPVHLFNLLNLTLPGLDVNDLEKTNSTLKFYFNVLQCVKIYENDIILKEMEMSVSPEDRDIFNSALALEEWALEFIKRAYDLLERMTMSDKSKRGPEMQMETVITNAAVVFFAALSPNMYKRVAKSFFNLVRNEMCTNGKSISRLCSTAAQGNPEIVIPMVVPDLCSDILEMCSRHGNSSEEDPRLVWDLRVLYQVLKDSNSFAITYKGKLKAVIRATFALKVKVYVKLGAKILRNCLKSSTLIYPTESAFIADSHHREDVPSFMEWGKPGVASELDVGWHVPSEADLDFADELVNEFLMPEIEYLRLVARGENGVPDEEEISNRLIVLKNMLKGVASLYPEYEGPLPEWIKGKRQITFISSRAKPRLVVEGAVLRERRKTQSYRGMREVIGTFLVEFGSFVAREMKDRTKVGKGVIKVVDVFLNNFGAKPNAADGQKRSYSLIKRLSRDYGGVRKSHTRFLLIMRVYIQHLTRIGKNSSGRDNTVLHQRLLMVLVEFGLSDYAEVRKKSQGVLLASMGRFRSATVRIFYHLVEELKKCNGDEAHNRAKGCLYMLRSSGFNKRLSFSFDETKDLLEALCHCSQFEKPSIQQLVASVQNSVLTGFYTSSLPLQTVPKSVADCFDVFGCSSMTISDQDLAASVMRGTEDLKYRKTDLESLLSFLAESLLSKQMHWSYEMLVMRILHCHMREDLPPSSVVVKCIVERLADHHCDMRNLAVKTLNSVLSFSKKKVEKFAAKSIAFGPGEGFGFRKSNEHLCARFEDYDKNEFEKLEFLDRIYMGWSNGMNGDPPIMCYRGGKTNAVKTVSDMSDSDNVIFEYVCNEAYLKKVFETMISKSESDSWSTSTALMFKGLTRTYGLSVVNMIVPCVMELLESDVEENIRHRTASEAVAGIVRGSKHFDFETMEKFKEIVIPLVKHCIEKVTNETQSHWQQSLSYMIENRDPRRLPWLIKLICDVEIDSERMSTFTQCKHLGLMETLWLELLWKCCSLTLPALQMVEKKLFDPYKNVRQSVSRVLHIAILSNTVPVLRSNGFLPERMVRKDPIFLTFFEKVLVAVDNKKLEDNNMDIEATPYRNISKLLCSMFSESYFAGWSISLLPYYEPFLSRFAAMTECIDPELEELSKMLFFYMPQSEFNTFELVNFLKSLKTLSKSENLSWHARVVVLKCLQVLIFRNVFNLKNMNIAEIIFAIILSMLKHEQLEVRESAAETCSGLIRCCPEYTTNALIETFTELAASPLPPKKKGGQALQATVTASFEYKKKVAPRHAGVLGLASLVLAFPYTIPEFLPKVILLLGDHLYEPSPIKDTVKRCLSDFWRTHRDGWESHKTNFTLDELAVINDLLISPSYYA
eukprot:Nk52_evm24s2192 gene=Nk52_evmTU24s2192